jgi:putative addiction module component (TIGR02574 family)
MVGRLVASCSTWSLYLWQDAFMIDIAQTLTELTALPIHDRLRVVESLWDSIPPDSPVEISPEQRAELQRRIAAHERSPEQLLTWDEVLDRLRDSR